MAKRNKLIKTKTRRGAIGILLNFAGLCKDPYRGVETLVQGNSNHRTGEMVCGGSGELAQIQLSNFPRVRRPFPCQNGGKLDFGFLFLCFALLLLAFLPVMREGQKDPSTQVCPSFLKSCYDVIDRLVLNLLAAVAQIDLRRRQRPSARQERKKTTDGGGVA